MRKLPFILLAVLSTSLYAKTPEEIEKDKDRYKAIAAGSAVVTTYSGIVTNESFKAYKENTALGIASKMDEAHRNGYMIKPGNEGTYILKPQYGSDGKALGVSDIYTAKSDVNEVLDQAKKYDGVTVSILYSDKKAQEMYIKDLSQRIANLENKISEINEGGRANGHHYYSSDFATRQARIQEARTSIAQLKALKLKIERMKPEEFFKKYKGTAKIATIKYIDMKDGKELETLLKNASKKGNRVYSIIGHTSAENYLARSKTNLKTMIGGAFLTAAGTTTTITTGLKGYTDIFDGEESTKDDFKDSSDEIQSGSNVDNQ